MDLGECYYCVLGISENDNALDTWEFYFVRDKHDEIRKHSASQSSITMLSKSLDDYFSEILNQVLVNEDW